MNITRENIIASASEGASVPQEMSDIEKSARAIASQLGYDPDRMAYYCVVEQGPRNVWLLPHQQPQPLWHFFAADATAALSVLTK